MTYKLTVTLQRDLPADLEVIGEMDATTTRRRVALVQQLRKELQAAYTNGDIDGVFNIESLTIDGVTYAAKSGRKL